MTIFRIEIETDYSRSIRNTKQFASSVTADLQRSLAGLQSGVAAGGPAPSPRAAQGELQRYGGEVRAQLNRAATEGILPLSEVQKLKAALTRELAAAAREISTITGQNVRAPTETQLRRSETAASRRIEREQERVARAAAVEATAAETRARAAVAQTNSNRYRTGTAPLGDLSDRTGATGEESRLRQADLAARARALRSELGIAGQTEAQEREQKKATRATEDLARQLERESRAKATSRGGIPSDEALDAVGARRVQQTDELERLERYLADQAARQRAGDGNLFDQAGRQAAIGREFGLRHGLGEEEAFAARDADGSQTALRARLTALRRAREVTERQAVETERVSNKEMREATAALAATLRQRQILETQAKLIATEGLVDQEASLKVSQDLRRARMQQAVAAKIGEPGTENFKAIVEGGVAQERRAQQIETARVRELSTDQAYIAATASATAARKRLQEAVNSAARAELQASLTPEERGSRFQRLQAAISSRTGGAPRLPNEFLNLQQFTTSRFLTTAGFAASGALLYSGVTAVKTMVREAGELQKELSIIESQFTTLGASASGITFAQVRDDIIKISKETGVAADHVALIERQLAGAFASEKGVPDFARASQETPVALRLSQVTGLPEQEITDSLTAVSLAFNRNFTQIADNIVSLESRFGVLSTNIIQFTADIAPLGKELGYSAEQLSALGAVAQQVSGKTGTVLAEQFGRILPALREKQNELLTLLSQGAGTEKFVEPLIKAFADANGPEVLIQLIRAYKDLDGAQQNQLASLVGGTRQAAAFYAILNHGQETIDALALTSEDTKGAFSDRWDAYTKTVTFAFAKMQRALEAFGLQLFNAGIGDALVTIADAATFAATGAGALLSVVSDLNEALGGIPARLLGVAAGIYAIVRAAKAASEVKSFLGSALGSAAAGGAGQAAGQAAGGLFGGRFAIAAPAAAPAAAGLFGGTGPLALRGGAAVTALAGAAPYLATAVAAIAVAELKKSVDAKLDEGRQLITDFDVKVDALIAAGVKEIDIPKSLHPEDVASIEFSIPEKVFRAIFGQPSPTAAEETHTRLAVKEKELRQAQLKAIKDADVGKKGIGDYDYIAKGLKENPADPVFIAAMDKMIKEIGKKYPELAKELTALQLSSDATFQRAQDVVDALKTATDALPVLEQLQAQFALGEVGSAPLVAELDRQIAYQDVIITAAKREGDTDALTKAYQAKKGLVDLLKAQVGGGTTLDLLKLQGQLADTGGTTNPQADLDRAKAALASGQGSPLDNALAVIAAQKALYQDYVNSAKTEAEKLAREAEGFQYDPAALNIIIAAQVRAGANAALVETVAATVGGAIDTVRDRVVEMIIQYGSDAGVIERKIIEARIASLTASKAALQQQIPGADYAATTGVAIAAFDQEIARLNALAQSLGASPGDFNTSTGTTGGLDTSAATAESERKAARARQRQEEEARLAIRRAQANGDPVKLAQLDIEAANIAAKYAEDDAAKYSAQAQRLEAGQRLTDAQHDVAVARLELVKALTGEDGVASANADVSLAEQALAAAHGEAAKIRAMAGLVTAQRAQRDAIRDVTDSQSELVIAIANAAGDTVGAARESVEIAKRNLDRMISEHAGTEDINRAKANLVTQQAALRDADIQDRLGDIDYLQQIEQITTAQAIEMLQAVARMPGITEDMVRSIELKIRALQKDLSRDFQFNLGDIKLPNTYEIGRVRSSEAQGSSYQDNRRIVINQDNYNAQDYQQSIDELERVLNRAPTTGTVPRRY